MAAEHLQENEASTVPVTVRTEMHAPITTPEAPKQKTLDSIVFLLNVRQQALATAKT